jgi:formate dehydrogenase subunit delta
MHGFRSPVSDQPPVLRLFNDIAEQFRHQPVERAAPQVAAHLRQFWEPRMRAQLVSHVTVPSGDDLLDAVLAQL